MFSLRFLHLLLLGLLLWSKMSVTAADSDNHIDLESEFSLEEDDESKLSPKGNDPEPEFSPEEDDDESKLSPEENDRESEFSPEEDDDESKLSSEGNGPETKISPEEDDDESKLSPEGNDPEPEFSPEEDDDESKLSPEGNDPEPEFSSEEDDDESKLSPEKNGREPEFSPEEDDDESKLYPKKNDRESELSPEEDGHLRHRRFFWIHRRPVRKHPCHSRPCKNHGTCLRKGHGYRCSCRHGYGGHQCQYRILRRNPCRLRPCKNHGRCLRKGHGYRCSCRHGYGGLRCQHRILRGNPCRFRPCKNHGRCLRKGHGYRCFCRHGYGGLRCQHRRLPRNPCHSRPCKNRGRCLRRGNRYQCLCRRGYGGLQCQYGTSTCDARGDPHYTTFDGKRFDFQGACDYVFAQSDCNGNGKRRFTVITKNAKCGRRGASCLQTVTVRVNRYEIVLPRIVGTAIVNGRKIVRFPYRAANLEISNQACRWIFVKSGGLIVRWNARRRHVRVTVDRRYRGKTCGLCGNNNGNPRDDRIRRHLTCKPPVGPSVCRPRPGTQRILRKCSLMTSRLSPFAKCHSKVNPVVPAENCKYDACECSDPMKCVCDAFSDYADQCAEAGVVIDWRFKGTFLYQPLTQCAQTCKHPEEIFTECGSSCTRTCRDLSRTDTCQEECVDECQCPKGKVFNDLRQCVPIARCPCHHEGKVYQAGGSVDVGNCKICTCSDGRMECVEDRECTKGPCDSMPCKNQGICRVNGKTFVCKCIGDFQGKTCEEPKPKPCDSKPCRNGGVCVDNKNDFICECDEGFQGKTCGESKPKPCDSSPCQNGGVCTNDGSSFSCKCTGNFQGKTCKDPKPKPCDVKPCKNGGTCYNEGHTFVCECGSKFQGNTCETSAPPLNPCDTSPCKNGGSCLNKGTSFTCKCRPNFIGSRCQKEIPDPCKPNPCKNGGVCERLSHKFACTCKPNFGGRLCQHGQTTCTAQGDPHYTTFDGKRIDFMGKCHYIFASVEDVFKIITRNEACGRGRATCTAAVKIFFGEYEIGFSRNRGTVILDDVKITTFPIVRPTFTITNPTPNWLRMVTNAGLTVSWDCRTVVRVSISGKYKGKTAGLCGNNDGNPADDTIDPNLPCSPEPGDEGCTPSQATHDIIRKCELMKQAPFAACNSLVNPSALIKNCKYDACRCDDPMKCVCGAFAAYTKRCSGHGKVINWRFAGTFLFKPLGRCAQTCNPGEVFTECGSSIAQTCRDLSREINNCQECIPGCQCPPGKVRNDEYKCVPIAQCSCRHEGKVVLPGDSVDVGNCKTCTCNGGSLVCVEDRECASKGPCDSFPCKNDGICTAKGSSFSCKCLGEYQGKTCEELKPKPCDSSPCQNSGTCVNKGSSFTCECTKDFKGKVCGERVQKPCDSSPCKNDGTCNNEGNSFICICVGDFEGKTCEDVKCSGVKLDILFVVDGSSSVGRKNFERMKDFVKKLTSKFDIGPDKAHVGLIQFSSKVKEEFGLQQYTTLAALKNAIGNVNILYGRTKTGAALKVAREKVFTGHGNDRSDAPNVLILLTDGEANDGEILTDQAKALQKKGVTIITVGVGRKNIVDHFFPEIQAVASSGSDGKKLAYRVEFTDLSSIANELAKKSCSAQANTTT